MRTDKVKELAEHCLRYVTPVCVQNNHSRIDVLEQMQLLIRSELNRAAAMDPMRNR